MTRNEVAEALAELRTISDKASRVIPAEISTRLRIESYEKQAVQAMVRRVQELAMRLLSESEAWYGAE